LMFRHCEGLPEANQKTRKTGLLRASPRNDGQTF
jgi:hypothetical protein